jgi:hypothetical protein
MTRMHTLAAHVAAALTLTFAGNAGAQVVFNETFTDPAGPCTQATAASFFPTGWTRFNVDALTPHANVAYVTNSWVVREDFAPLQAGFPTTECVAFSTSWYVPAGTSNDFMCTPQIAVGALSELRWRAGNYDPAYPDGYEVRVMRVTPTGGAGNIGNLITDSTVVFSTPAETADQWAPHTVDLDAAGFVSENIHVCFRNNANDKFVLVLDDVVVENFIPPPDNMFADGFEDPPPP